MSKTTITNLEYGYKYSPIKRPKECSAFTESLIHMVEKLRPNYRVNFVHPHLYRINRKCHIMVRPLAPRRVNYISKELKEYNIKKYTK